MKQRRYPDAEREFQAELTNDPKHALSLAYQGDMMLRDGHSTAALVTLKQAEALNNSLHLVHQDLGSYYQNENQMVLAVKEFQEAVRTAPGNYDGHYRLARIYQKLGRDQEAAQEFGIVQKLHEQKKRVADEDQRLAMNGEAFFRRGALLPIGTCADPTWKSPVRIVNCRSWCPRH